MESEAKAKATTLKVDQDTGAFKSADTVATEAKVKASEAELAHEQQTVAALKQKAEDCEEKGKDVVGPLQEEASTAKNEAAKTADEINAAKRTLALKDSAEKSAEQE